MKTKIRRWVSLTTLVIFFTGLVMFIACWTAIKAQAQIDDFTYFIPYPANHTSKLYDLGNDAPEAGIDHPVRTIISIALARDGTIIYYDHWEDGYETNITTPTSACTEVWGDDDVTNGQPPNYGGVDDRLAQAKPVVLSNLITVPIPTTTTTCIAPGNFPYDGGDKLTAVRGNVTISLANWLELPHPFALGPLYAGAWELYPTAQWGTNFVLPIGEDLGGFREGFMFTKVNLQAAKDNTIVDLDLDADGVFEARIWLDEGEQFTQPLTDGLKILSGSILANTHSGARISSTHKIQAHLFTSNPAAYSTSLATTYESRAYSLIPRDAWQSDYIAPRGSDSDFWLHNPDIFPLDVQITDNTGAVFTRTIPANSTISYPPHPPFPNVLTVNTGLRFRAPDGRSFFGVAAAGSAAAQDWGYALIPTANLNAKNIIGWAPGSSILPPDSNQSQLYVTALNPTTITVEFNNTPAVPLTQFFVITPLHEIAISDIVDFDLTGAYLYSENDEPFAAVWGQDQFALNGIPSLHLGIAIVPVPSLSSQKLLKLAIDADNSETISWGDVVTYTIVAINNARTSYNPLNVQDALEPSLTYIDGSTELVRSSGTTAIPDAGTTTFPLDEGGYNIPGGLEMLEIISVTFRARIRTGVNRVENEVTITGGTITSIASIETSVLTGIYLTGTYGLYLPVILAK